MATRFTFLALLILAATAGAAGAAPAVASRPTPAAQSSAARRAAPATPGSAFALRLYRQLAAGGDNAFLSPFSVSSALAMAAEGARGPTARQMAATLGGGPDALAASLGPVAKRLNQPGKHYEVAVANALWADRTFPVGSAYQASVKTRYGVGLFAVDFRGASEPSRQRINAWVEQQTRNRIKDLVPAGAITSMTRLVLTNAIYFKGKWATPFTKSETRPQPFRRAGGGTADVPMMRNENLHARFARFVGFRALEMEYQGGDLSMVVVLPDDVGGLARLEKRLKPDSLAVWLDRLRSQSVDVWLPRFRLETTYELKPALAALGMPLAFDAARADFGGIARTPGEPLFLSAVLHKAFVEVNEEGTEAAAATGGIMATTAMPIAEKAEFHADHPFLFLIREQASGAILFMGRVTDPAR